MHDPVSFKRLLAVMLAVLLAMINVNPAVAGEHDQTGVGIDVSGFHSFTFGGEPVDGSIFRRSTLTVVNIWQRWCGPCWAEMPDFARLYEHYCSTPEDDVQVWGVLYYDNPHQIQQAVEFTAENGYNWDQMLFCDEFRLAASCGGAAEYLHIPQTLIIDRRGVVRAQIIGKVEDYDELFGLTEQWLGILSDEYAESMGDVDANGEVDTLDALTVMRFSIGLTDGIDPFFADVDANGTVNTVDALLILRAALGLISL
ncbi:MAG: redoxin domain-containing protein [Clostridia bacterium]|nr:redoxin domain-containing protein [Clostridia bacterium]